MRAVRPSAALAASGPFEGRVADRRAVGLAVAAVGVRPGRIVRSQAGG
ncbi:MAG TPA: hypothetical protein VNI83_15935 [Vicinamibacterales bacterium]|nr:hypothetical protein [Vicinamibacterales bacterium]